MNTPCGFHISCEHCNNYADCTSTKCLGFVPWAYMDDVMPPYITIMGGECSVDCPYIQACLEKKDKYEELKIKKALSRPTVGI